MSQRPDVDKNKDEEKLLRGSFFEDKRRMLALANSITIYEKGKSTSTFIMFSHFYTSNRWKNDPTKFEFIRFGL